MMDLICADCYATFETADEADRHEDYNPTHLTFYRGFIPDDYVHIDPWFWE
jgi:hypothetical protein